MGLSISQRRNTRWYVGICNKSRQSTIREFRLQSRIYYQSSKGQKISSYTDSECPFSKGFKNWKIGLTSNGTITEQSCAKEVIAVGAYNTTVSLQLANNSTKP